MKLEFRRTDLDEHTIVTDVNPLEPLSPNAFVRVERFHPALPCFASGVDGEPVWTVAHGRYVQPYMRSADDADAFTAQLAHTVRDVIRSPNATLHITRVYDGKGGCAQIAEQLRIIDDLTLLVDLRMGLLPRLSIDKL